jgi:cobalt-zinc-cadmium efflux system outer membrane protein
MAFSMAFGRSTLALAALVVAASRAAAQSAPALATSHGITLTEALRHAVAANPDLAIAGAAVDSARAEKRIARAFPNPILAATPNSPYQYSATLPLDITPQRYYRVKVASLGADATGWDRKDAERQLSGAVAQAFVDALLAQEKLRLAVDRQTAVAEILRADSLRFETGDVPAQALARSEVELVRALADVARARTDVRTARLALQASAGFEHPDTSLAAAGSLEFSPLVVRLDSVRDVAFRQRPDLLATRERVSQAVSAQGAARALLVPTPELAYVRQRSSPFDNGHYYAFGLAFELPSLNTYRGQRERAAASSSAAHDAERRARAQTERDVVAATANLDEQRALVERYRSGLIAKVDAGVEAMRYAYSRGAASLLEVLDAVQAQQQVHADYLVALHDYSSAVFALATATGSEITGVVP